MYAFRELADAVSYILLSNQIVSPAAQADAIRIEPLKAPVMIRRAVIHSSLNPLHIAAEFGLIEKPCLGDPRKLHVMERQQ